MIDGGWRAVVGACVALCADALLDAGALFIGTPLVDVAAQLLRSLSRDDEIEGVVFPKTATAGRHWRAAKERRLSRFRRQQSPV